MESKHRDEQAKTHKKEMIKSGLIAAGAGVAAVAALSIIYVCGYSRGVVLGGAAGFGATVEWLEETFPEKGIKAAVEAYKKANPDKWVTIK